MSNSESHHFWILVGKASNMQRGASKSMVELNRCAVALSGLPFLDFHDF
jgi:hypothetical protein